MYNLGEQINSIRTLVEHAEGLTEDAFTARAVMHRMKSDRSLEVIAVDIAGIMNGSVADVPLKEMMFSLSRQDKRRFLRELSPSAEKYNIQESINMLRMKRLRISCCRLVD